MDFENVQIEFSEIPTTQNITLKPIESNYKRVIIFSWLIFYLLVLFAFLLCFFLIDDLKKHNKILYFGLAALMFFCFVTLIWIKVEFKYRSFAVRQKDIVYKSGWLFQKTTAVPYNKIQHCSVSQGLFSRIYKLANLQIFTAASNNFDVVIKGLKLADAEQLKDWLMQQNKV